MQFSRFIVACWLVLGYLFAGIAHADDPMAKPKDAGAREHLTKGNKLYRLREFDKAIEEYKAGALSEDATVFAYNLGQCYRQLGKYDDAIWHYERFLSRGQPTGEMKTAVEEFVRQMKAERDKKAMTQQPTEPAPDNTMKPQADARPIVPEPAITENADPWYADGFGWGLSGVGVVAVASSGYLLLNAADLDDQANAEDQQDVRLQLRDKASSRRLAGTIVGIGGVGILVTGVVRLVIHSSPKRERATASWNLGVTGSGVQVFGTF